MAKIKETVENPKEPNEKAPSPVGPGPSLFVFTIDASTGEIGGLEKVDGAGARRLLSDQDKASLQAGKSWHTLESIVEQATFHQTYTEVSKRQIDDLTGLSAADLAWRRLRGVPRSTSSDKFKGQSLKRRRWPRSIKIGEGAALAPVACGLYARQALDSPAFPVQNICA